MITDLALALVLTTGPDMPSPIQIGPKTHSSPVSLYQGRHYSESHNPIRVCIRQRESNHDYRAVSRGGSHRGAYQMSAPLGVGAGWMIQEELADTGIPKDTARNIGTQLRQHPVNQWQPFWQDFAFWLIWDNGNGAFHWNATILGTSCFGDRSAHAPKAAS